MRRSFDRHLNIFWGYNGRPYSEDNLTRAFITTLSSWGPVHARQPNNLKTILK